MLAFGTWRDIWYVLLLPLLFARVIVAVIARVRNSKYILRFCFLLPPPGIALCKLHLCSAGMGRVRLLPVVYFEICPYVALFPLTYYSSISIQMFPVLAFILGSL